MFEEHNDKKAAADEMLEVLISWDVPIDENDRKKFKTNFVKGFLVMYKKYRKFFASKAAKRSRSWSFEDYKNQIRRGVLQSFDESADYAQKAKAHLDKSYVADGVVLLGNAYGSLFSAIEYGLTQSLFEVQKGDEEHILKCVAIFVNALQGKHKLKHSFIAHRVKKIAAKTEGSLSKEKFALITNIMKELIGLT